MTDDVFSFSIESKEIEDGRKEVESCAFVVSLDFGRQ